MSDNITTALFFSQHPEYEKVEIEGRVAKTQARRKVKQKQEELKGAVKVSWLLWQHIFLNWEVKQLQFGRSHRVLSLGKKSLLKIRFESSKLKCFW